MFGGVHAEVDQTLRAAMEHHKAGRFRDAEALYRKVLSRDPQNADALHLLGVIAFQMNRPDMAAELIARAIQVDPSAAEFHKDMGNAMRGLGRIDDAVACQRRALELRPDFGEAHFNLGNLYQSQGKLDEAAVEFRRVIELEPGLAEAYTNLGNVLQLMEKLEEADEAYQKSIYYKPDLARAHSNRGILLVRRNMLDEAAEESRRAIEAAPTFPEAHNNLATVLLRQGDVDGSIFEYRQAIALEPRYVRAHSNLLFALHHHPRISPEQLLEEHRQWARQHAEPLLPAQRPHENPRDPERKLRVGYVSPDFREHPMARFLLPLLAAHDRTRFEVVCFADVHKPDDVTNELQSHGDSWHFTTPLNDAQLTELIGQNRIDVLVDLALHTSGNRMLTFAHKPAPVQVTYLAYPGTSGMRQMDYRLTDARLDPPENDRFYVEKSLRLPETYWCYQPYAQAPRIVSALPAQSNGFITFGSLNNPAKLSGPTLLAWAELMEKVPNSRLILHADPGSHVQRMRDAFAKQGVDQERIEFLPRQPIDQYLGVYERMDIALDPFPYNGATTTFDALWMGVPVVSLAGQIAVQRAGLSILSTCGLPDLVADNWQAYIEIGTNLANDLVRLANLRTNLRERLKASPLMNASQFARQLEQAFRQMWRAWCAGSS